MYRATVQEVRAAYPDPRQPKLSLPEPPPKAKPDVLLKWRWLNRYFDRLNHLQCGALTSTSAVHQHAAAIAYRHTVERAMAEFRATEDRAEKFLAWCGLTNKYLDPVVARETLEHLEFVTRRKRGEG